MTRVKTGSVRKNKHKKIIRISKGFTGSNSNLFRTVNQRVMKSRYYSYFDRKKNKTKFRTLWIIRINSASQMLKLSYNKLINILKINNVILNRKILSEILLRDVNVFKRIIVTIRLR